MSSAVDPDVARSVASGRETIGELLASAKSDLRKAFLAFVVGLLGTVYVLRQFVWARLRADLNTNPDIEVIAVTPFDVILLQVKIGIAIGILFALPVVIYYGRDALMRRGYWPTGVSRWKVAVVALVASVLFVGGAAYAYVVFFPAMFGFLAGNAIQAGFEPTYSIVKWTQFIFLLTLSFGLAAQLPIAMAGLAYTDVVRYETFRDRWKYAVVGIFAFGAVLSPPDPFTQIMWGIPLLVLYAGSLGFTRLIVAARDSGRRIDLGGIVRDRWNLVGAAALVAGGAVYALGRAVAAGAADRYAAAVGLAAPRPSVLLVGGLAAAAGLLGGGLALGYFVLHALEAADDPGPAAPAEIDLSALDAAGIRAAPPEAFADLTEEEAVALAGEAMDEDPDRAQAILDRFDEVDGGGSEADGPTDAAAGESEAEGGLGGTVASTGAGMLGAFTEDDLDEEEVGGYYYDIAFVLDSLTSKAFWLVGWFMLVLAGTFVFLYRGGIGELKRVFLSRLPETVRPEQVQIVTLHPVEALVFEVKVSTIVAAAACLPILLYFAWPALKQRGLAQGDRRVILAWGGSLLVGCVLGVGVGFLSVAPAIISWLTADVVGANMVVAYRINSFGWLVFFTTVGVGLLFDVPVSMLLFVAGGLVPYESFRNRWREVAIAVFAVVAVLSPRGVFMMFIIGIPIMATYGIGLALAWAYAVLAGGGGPGGGSDAADIAD